MAAVHIGRRLGPAGFSKTVAIKRLHAHFARDPEFVAMFLDEARLAARIEHTNVVSTLDVVTADHELFLVMEYVHGESLEKLIRTSRKEGTQVSPSITSAVVSDLLLGLQAAHEATDERGAPLGIVHRDVSPHNVIVGLDGICRVLDFGVAKAVWRLQSTRDGQLKGKLSYMAPEQLSLEAVDHRADLFAAGVVLWEMLTGRRLFHAEAPGAVVHQIMAGEVERPSLHDPKLPRGIDELVLRALARNSEDRFPSALAMAQQLDRLLPPAPRLAVGNWATTLGGAQLREREAAIAGLVDRHESAYDFSASGEHVMVPGLSSVLPLGLLVPGPPGRPRPPPSTAGTETDLSGVIPVSDGSEPVSRRSDLPDPPVPKRSDPNQTGSQPVPGRSDPDPSVRWRPAVLVLGAICVAAIFGVLGLRAEGQTEAASGPAASVAPSISNAVPSSTAASPVAVVASVTTLDAGHDASPPRSSPPHPRWKPPRPATKLPAAKPDCDPPYTLDEDGAKRFKPSCFK